MSSPPPWQVDPGTAQRTLQMFIGGDRAIGSLAVQGSKRRRAGYCTVSTPKEVLL
jgi:hypothetical protein